MRYAGRLLLLLNVWWQPLGFALPGERVPVGGVEADRAAIEAVLA